MSVYVTALVSDDGMGVPGNKHHCVIANAIMLADDDIVRPMVDKQHIKFSRRSTGERYVFATPAKAAAYIGRFDQLEPTERRKVKGGFRLALSDDNLVAVYPMRKVDRQASIRKNATRQTPARKRKSPAPRKFSERRPDEAA